MSRRQSSAGFGALSETVSVPQLSSQLSSELESSELESGPGNRIRKVRRNSAHKYLRILRSHLRRCLGIGSLRSLPDMQPHNWRRSHTVTRTPKRRSWQCKYLRSQRSWNRSHRSNPRYHNPRNHSCSLCTECHFPRTNHCKRFDTPSRHMCLRNSIRSYCILRIGLQAMD